MESREYIDLIKSAMSEVGSDYYKLQTTYEPSGIVRERVFCYELYHQIRSQMKDHHKLFLHGEIDKSGHKDFEHQDWRNPDFVFHIPGTHEYNTIVIEVKGKLSNYKSEIEGDFQNLLTFICKYAYALGIFILYNHSFTELMDSLGSRIGELSTVPEANSVFILCVKTPYQECEEHLLSEILP